ncbi:hypothetical protein Y032_0557g3393 [Ancylostoma ceylanicum]|uniref:Cullin family profile domain-containing protein n=1 Tax=Ancylostoma ceylanicum TaxID=53326 RepID=A0A016WRW6_9BILA|nr:hypothetical protein Y032_0557g3393 [Ancylostoma ceylanicum]
MFAKSHFNAELVIRTTSAGASNGNSEATSFILPAILQPSIADFEKYYIGAHNGRKLTWLFNMSHGEIRLTYLDKPYLVSMSVYQMSVILCFQDSDTISEIVGSTRVNIVIRIFQKVLQGFSYNVKYASEASTIKSLEVRR